MPPEVSGGRKTFSAAFALVRSLTSVRAHVLSEIGGMIESLIANRACIRLNSGVSEHVSTEVGLYVEALGANWARKMVLALFICERELRNEGTYMKTRFLRVLQYALSGWTLNSSSLVLQPSHLETLLRMD